MRYEQFVELIKKNIYVTAKETFDNPESEQFVDRFVGKHPLLKPELIIQDDSLQGFKSTNRKYKSLEKFPIYIEIEGVIEDDERFIDSIDIYTEAHVKCQSRISDVMYLARRYEKTCIIDRIIRLTDLKAEYLVIMSKIQEIFPVDDDDESDLLKEEVDTLLKDFVNVLQCINDVTVKGKSIMKLQKEGLC